MERREVAAATATATVTEFYAVESIIGRNFLVFLCGGRGGYKRCIGYSVSQWQQHSVSSTTIIAVASFDRYNSGRAPASAATAAATAYGADSARYLMRR